MKKILVAALLLPISSFAYDETQDIGKEIEQLKTKIIKLENLLNKNIEEQKSRNIEEQKTRNIDKVSKEVDNNSSNKAPTVKLGGKIEFDAAKIRTDSTNKGSGFNVRTARINVGGKIDENWKYKFEADFNNDKASLKKAHIDYVGLKDKEIRIGRFNQDFGINSENKFPESSIIGAIVPVNSDGIRINDHGTNWYGAFGVATSSFGSTKEAKDQSRTVFFRGSYSPVHNDIYSVHTGISAVYNKPRNLSHKIEYKQNFETNLSADAVKTKISNIKYTKTFGVDFGAIYGPFSFQTEYVGTKLVRANGIKDNYFDGAYAQIAYSLTGEKRGYNPSLGEFSNVTPVNIFDPKNGGMGAWELAFRYSYLNLNSNDSYGGKLINYSTSLNWYLNNYMHIRFNYIIGRTDKYGVNPNNKPQIFLVRTHISF